MARVLPALVAIVLMFLPSAARADDTMANDVASYYRSEKTIAYTFLGLGAASAAGGTVLVATRDEEFSRGLGWSLVVVGGIQAIGAAFYAFQVDAQDAKYGNLVANDPAAFEREEGDHIHGTTSRFVLYRTAEAALAIAGAGVAVYGFVAKKDAFKGAGIGVAAQAALFFVIDSFGQARANEYERRVKAFEPQITIAPSPSGASMGFTMPL